MNKAQEIAKVIRRRMLREAKATVGQSGVALSGGVDSCATLAALMEVGHEPIIVSYTPSTHESTDFKMARQTAINLGLQFHPVKVDMDADTLEELARVVAGLGFTSKVQMESLTPMVAISRVAAKAGIDVLFTGDQSDGYFALSFGASSGQGLHGELHKDNFPHKVTKDTDSRRIDAIREAYYAKDKSCSGMVHTVCQLVDVDTCFPFRDEKIYEAFLGSTWGEVNKPKVKMPIKIAWQDWFTPERIITMKRQSNLHKGDSRFGDTFAEIMHERFPGFRSNVGLYRAMGRGEI